MRISKINNSIVFLFHIGIDNDDAMHESLHLNRIVQAQPNLIHQFLQQLRIFPPAGRCFFFLGLIPMVQGLGALAVIFTYGLKFRALFIQPFNIPATVRKYFQDMEHAVLDNGHIDPLEASSDQ